MKIKFKKLEKSQIEANFELEASEFTKYIDRALESLKKQVKMDGFRPGTVPKEIAEKKISSENLLMEAGDLAVNESYEKIIQEKNLEPVEQPQIQIIKIAKGNPFLFKIKVAVLPEIKLPDYQVIAARIKPQETFVQEKEVEDALNYLQKSMAKFSQVPRAARKKDFVEIEYSNKNINEGKTVKDKFILGEGGFSDDFEDNIIGMAEGQEKEFAAKFPDNAPNGLAGLQSNFKVKVTTVKTVDLPEINQEFAQSLGNFDGLVRLKESIRDGLVKEKEQAQVRFRRDEILNYIVGELNFNVPENLVERETEIMFEDLKNQVSQNLGISFEEYLFSAQKTEQEIKKSIGNDAEKRIKKFLVLRQIGRKENIMISKDEIQEEINKLIKNYSREQLGEIDIVKLKEYTKGVIFNEKVFRLLEKLSQDQNSNLKSQN